MYIASEYNRLSAKESLRECVCDVQTDPEKLAIRVRERLSPLFWAVLNSRNRHSRENWKSTLFKWTVLISKARRESWKMSWLSWGRYRYSSWIMWATWPDSITRMTVWGMGMLRCCTIWLRTVWTVGGVQRAAEEALSENEEDLL